MKKESECRVKYRNAITKKDLSGLLKFLRIYNLSEGLIISKSSLEEIKIDNKKIKLIPAPLYALIEL